MKISKSIKEAENKEWFEATKLCFLEVIKVGLKHSQNPEMKKAVKQTIMNYKEFLKQYEE